MTRETPPRGGFKETDMVRYSWALILACLSIAVPVNAEESMSTQWQQMHGSKQQALDAFSEAKFGMFIHWGLYAIPAGEWKGERLPGISEWIMTRADIPRAEYVELAKQFNPVLFDASQWAEIASDAGMRYMVMTSKHHDGFAMFDSDASDFNVVDATPFGRDVVGELYAACERQGMKFGVYYSHSIDWSDGGDGGYALAGSGDVKWAPNLHDPSPTSFTDYIQTKAKPQVRELLEKYPNLWLIWYDVPFLMPSDMSYDFYKLTYELSPQTLCASRIGNNFGDYLTPGDNEIPADYLTYDRPWETVGTMNNSWGFKHFDHDWKSTDELLYWLVEVVSKGGNYMLNVGPNAQGQIPVESIERLREIGRWMKVNSEAIYSTTRWTTTREGPTLIDVKGTREREAEGFKAQFTPEDIWYTRNGQTVYAIALVAPEDRKARLTSFGSEQETAPKMIKSVRLLGSDAGITWEQQADALHVTLPTDLPGEHGYALAIETE